MTASRSVHNDTVHAPLLPSAVVVTTNGAACAAIGRQTTNSSRKNMRIEDSFMTHLSFRKQPEDGLGELSAATKKPGQKHALRMRYLP
jgi:hypothetical protein